MSDLEPIPSGGVAYKVVSQNPQLVKGPTGNFTQGMRITAQVVGSGSTFYVDVPQANYNAVYVRQLLAAQAAEVGAIDSIGN